MPDAVVELLHLWKFKPGGALLPPADVEQLQNVLAPGAVDKRASGPTSSGGTVNHCRREAQRRC